MNDNDKSIQYAAQILEKIQELFEDESFVEELQTNDNMTAFFQALANTTPTQVYNKVTGEDLNTLQFNHIANQLVFQFSVLKSDAE
jgi:Tfp pilus assembly protein PilN